MKHKPAPAKVRGPSAKAKSRATSRERPAPEDLGSMLLRLLNEPMTITEYGIRRQVTPLEVIIIQLSNAARAGSSRAATVFFRFDSLVTKPSANRMVIGFSDSDHDSDFKTIPADGEQP